MFRLNKRTADVLYTLGKLKFRWTTTKIKFKFKRFHLPFSYFTFLKRIFGTKIIFIKYRPFLICFAFVF